MSISNKYDKYIYRIADIDFYYGNKNASITIAHNLISAINIYNDYENNISPSMIMTMRVPYANYYELISNMNTMTAHIIITKLNIGSDVDNIDKLDTSGCQESPWIDSVLKVTSKNDINVANIKAYDFADTEKSEVEKNKYFDLTLYLYDIDRITKYRKKMSYIMNGTYNDLLYCMFADRGLDRILISNIKDSASKNFAIPYGHLGYNLQQLNHIYGLYDSPYLFYMDLTRIYLIDKQAVSNSKNMNNSALEVGEYPVVNITLDNPETYRPDSTGSYIDESSQSYKITTSNIVLSDRDSLIDYVYGGTIKSIISGSSETLTTKSGEYDIEEAFVVNNEKEHKQIVFKNNELKRPVSVAFEYIDVTIMTPNKRFDILPDNTYYSDFDIGGSYRLLTSEFRITQLNDSDYICNSAFSFNRIDMG